MVADDLLTSDQTKRYCTWQAAKEFLHSLEGRYVFRGVSSADWVLVTTLDRAVQYHAPAAEEVLVDSFRKALPEHTPDVPPWDARVSWLALMRHYGLPSRLLDVTESHLVAAYFAAQTRKPEFAIWAFQKEGLQRAAEAALGIIGPPLSPVELGSSSLFSAVFTTPKRFIALIDTEHRTARQRAQQGLFLCPGDPSEPFWRNLGSDICDTPSFVCRVVLPTDAGEAIAKELDGTDINHLNLLPDTHHVEYLCRTLKTLLSKSQELCGHFQWKLQVKPLLMEHGLLDLNLNTTV